MSEMLEKVLRSNIYFQPIHFILSITTNIVNIHVLSCRIFRLSPCTHYFLAYAIYSIIYTCLICPTQFLRAFHIHWANGRINCKLYSYFLFVLPFQANIMLVFAAFDRYCSSSQSRLFHSKSTIRTARKIIIFNSLICTIYLSPMLIIAHWDNQTKRCLPISNLFVNLYIFSQVIIYYILSPLLMIIFGLLTIANIRKQSTRVISFAIIARRRRTERNLARMLLLQVSVHLIISIPYGVIYSMNAFEPSTQTSYIIALRLAFVTWNQCDYFISFFLYILSASVYRQQLVLILKSNTCSNTLIGCFVHEQPRTLHTFPLQNINLQATNNMR